MIIVTGTGRSGTGYMSKLLISAGINIGHEQIYTISGYKRKAKFKGDSSWLAAPLIKNFKQTTIIHAVRYPIDTINSFLNIGLFEKSGSPYYKYMARYLPSMNNHKNPVDIAFHYVIKWNEMIFGYSNKRYFLHRIEDDPIPLIKWIKGDTSDLFDNKKYNTRKKSNSDNRKYKLTDNDVPKKWHRKYFELKHKMGYE